MPGSYDPTNAFARILRGELPCRKAYEDEWALAFHDINPLAPVHVLVVPKGAYTDMSDFAARAAPEEVTGFLRAVGRTAGALGVLEGGYRVLANCGRDANQEVPHLHLHLFAGAPLGPMLARAPA